MQSFLILSIFLISMKGYSHGNKIEMTAIAVDEALKTFQIEELDDKVSQFFYVTGWPSGHVLKVKVYYYTGETTPDGKKVRASILYTCKENHDEDSEGSMLKCEKPIDEDN